MIELLNIDCMDLMSKYPDKYFDLAICDPPYGIGIAEWDNKPGERYFNELFRVSKKQIIWGGNYFTLPHTEAWICWHKTAGFKRRALNGQSDFELAWTNFDRKARLIPYTYSGNIKGLTKNRTDYNYKPIHPTQKPVELYKLVLEDYATNGDKILDTHLGSGSIAIAIHQTNVTEKTNLFFVGCEIDENQFKKTIKRYNEQISQTILL